jgi:hypothetical protein
MTTCVTGRYQCSHQVGVLYEYADRHAKITLHMDVFVNRSSTTSIQSWAKDVSILHHS